MKNYSILRIGNEYVVQADEKSVLKVASRRKAARLVTDAAELMDAQPVAPEPALEQNPPAQTLPEQALPEHTLPEHNVPSIACDSILDPSEVP